MSEGRGGRGEAEGYSSRTCKSVANTVPVGVAGSLLVPRCTFLVPRSSFLFPRCCNASVTVVSRRCSLI